MGRLGLKSQKASDINQSPFGRIHTSCELITAFMRWGSYETYETLHRVVLEQNTQAETLCALHLYIYPYYLKIHNGGWQFARIYLVREGGICVGIPCWDLAQAGWVA
jgi:hypothetical protein